METHQKDQAIVQALILLAHTVGIDVVAEGAETADHLVHLQILHCDYVQGYGIALPLDMTDTEAFLITWKQRQSAI